MESYGMHINVDKTKTMVFGRKMEDNDASIHINGTVLENVESFVCLGSELRGTTTARETYAVEYRWQ